MRALNTPKNLRRLPRSLQRPPNLAGLSMKQGHVERSGRKPVHIPHLACDFEVLLEEGDGPTRISQLQAGTAQVPHDPSLAVAVAHLAGDFESLLEEGDGPTRISQLRVGNAQVP